MKKHHTDNIWIKVDQSDTFDKITYGLAFLFVICWLGFIILCTIIK